MQANYIVVPKHYVSHETTLKDKKVAPHNTSIYLSQKIKHSDNLKFQSVFFQDAFFTTRCRVMACFPFIGGVYS